MIAYALIFCLIIAWTTIDSDAEDAFAFLQIIEAWVNETIAVKLACSLSLG